MRADKISAVGIRAAGRGREVLGCKALVLACNGFGGNAALVRQHIPEIADGLYYGHQGNTGDALVWGQTLGARSSNICRVIRATARWRIRMAS
jgi:fumarate reductase flavoprotein subunit